ncbi:NIPSNAP family protein [Streptomyces armeniacus]|uniref:NIPSNAP family protein n=1 Tax=Streptomyces armeniacus TaxID=83291 RepID=UPI001FE3B51F|nr:NIPSNAP family protein [Streptomyces armeniacus]
MEYVIDPAKTERFEEFAHRWMELVARHGGEHHGYFLPSEGASDRALALFSFPSLAAYENYRELFGTDPDFVAADRIRDESGCVLRHERTFMRPLLPDSPPADGLPDARDAPDAPGLPGGDAGNASPEA